MPKYYHLLLSMLIIASISMYEATQYTPTSNDSSSQHFDDKRGYIPMPSKKKKKKSSSSSKNYHISLPQVQEDRMISCNQLDNSYNSPIQDVYNTQGYERLLPKVKKDKRSEHKKIKKNTIHIYKSNNNQGDETSLYEKKKLFPPDNHQGMSVDKILQWIEEKERDLERKNKKLDDTYCKLMQERKDIDSSKNDKFFYQELLNLRQHYQDRQGEITNVVMGVKNFLQEKYPNYSSSPKVSPKKEKKICKKTIYSITELRGGTPFHLQNDDFKKRINQLTLSICNISGTQGVRSPETFEAIENQYNQSHNQITSNLLFSDLCFLQTQPGEGDKMLSTFCTTVTHLIYLLKNRYDKN